MLSMAAMGIYLGAAIDTYGRFSKKKLSFNLLVAFNDVLFWLVQGLIVFYVLFQTNNGEIRFYIFLALLCGYACYQALLRTVYQTILERVIQASISIYHFFVNLIVFLLVNPIKYLLKVIYSFCMMIITAIVAVLLYLLRMIWKPIRWIFLLILKWTGFDHKIEKSILKLKKIKDFLTSLRKKKE